MCLSRFYLDISFTLLSREKGPLRINLLVIICFSLKVQDYA